MDNIRDISKSYFIHKNKIKDKVKKRINKIEYYQEVINSIVKDNKYETKLNSYDKQFIDVCEEIITEYKKKILKDTEIFFY